MATRPEPGKPVRSGKRFALAEEARPDWLKWKPHLQMTAAGGLPETARPRPVRAVLTYRLAGFRPSGSCQLTWYSLNSPSLL